MFPVVKDFHYKFQAWKSMSALLLVRRGIPKILSGLTSANKKLSSKNLSLLSLFDMEKVETTFL